MFSKRKHAVLFTHACLSDYITGAEKYLLLLLKALIHNHNYHCTLVAPCEGVLTDQARKSGATIIVHAYPKTTALWKPHSESSQQLQQLMQDSHMNELFKLIHSLSPDLVITSTSVNPLPAVAAKRIGVPLMWLLCEVIPETPWTDEVIAFMDRSSDWLIGISKAVINPFQQRGISRDKTAILYPSWEGAKLGAPNTWPLYAEQLRERLGVPNSDILVGFVAADLVPHKGLDHYAILAVALSRMYPNLHFVIAGHQTDPNYYQQCMQTITDAGCRARVHTLPFHADLRHIYPAMDLLVVPSTVDEGFGMTALEGMIFGKPVLVYHSGGLAEIAEMAGDPKLIVPKGNEAALTEKAAELLKQGKPALQKYAQSSQRAYQVFGPPAYRQRLDQIMQQVQPRLERQSLQQVRMRAQLPEGVLLKGASPEVYYIERGCKRHIADGPAFYFYQYKWENVVMVDDQQLNFYPIGRSITREGLFQHAAPDGLLVKGSGPGIYLWTDKRLLPFASAEAFAMLNYHISEVVVIPDTIIQALPKGMAITPSVFETIGVINYRLYVSPDGLRWYGQQHRLRRIDHALFQNYKWNPAKIIQLSYEAYQRLPQGPPLRR